jgi:DMATS type aromatic prenyltransferase
MGIDGSSMEYSWKWNTNLEDRPEIRYVVETINERSGTVTDPLNQQPGRDFMHQVQKVVPTADFGWTHYFLAHLFDHDIAKLAAENNAGVPAVGTLAHAVEYSPKGLGIKSYISSRTLGSRGGRASLDFWNAAIRKLNPDNANLDILMKFTRENSYGRHLVPL